MTELNRRPVGGTGVRLTELGFGAAPIGNLYAPVDDDEARATVDAAWQAGIRYFDTAPHYGLGLSERRLGAALAGRPREQFVISTKVGRLLVDNPAPVGSDQAAGFAVRDDLRRIRDYSADGVRRSLESSLLRLGLDRVDILYVHDPEDFLDQAIGEAIPALVDLRDQGVIGALGAGMNLVAPLRRIVTEADVDVVMVAGRWTLLDRSAADLVADCADRDVALVAAAPFNSGILARPEPPAEATFDYTAAPPELLARARSMAAACARHGVELPQAALQFALQSAPVSSVVAGLLGEAQVRAAADRITRPVPDALWPDLVP